LVLFSYEGIHVSIFKITEFVEVVLLRTFSILVSYIKLILLHSTRSNELESRLKLSHEMGTSNRFYGATTCWKNIAPLRSFLFLEVDCDVVPDPVHCTGRARLDKTGLDAGLIE
jgi:hypothetical protein